MIMLASNEMMNNWSKNWARWLQKNYEKIYSYYKFRQTGLLTDYTLNLEERKLCLLMQQMLMEPNTVVYDIGAANGKTAQFFAKLNNIISIQAFEPVKASYNSLAKVAIKFPKIKCHNIALGNETGTQNLYVNNWVNSSSFLRVNSLFSNEVDGVDNIKDEEEVAVFRLDEYVNSESLKMPDIVKIDVQGYEKQVIEGGKDVLARSKFCFMEMSFQSLYKDSCLFEELYESMIALDFRLVGISRPMIGKSGMQLQVDGIFQNKRFC